MDNQIKSPLGKKSVFRRIFADNSYCWLSCLCTLGIMMLVYFCYSLFPFGESTILRMDLYHQYGPLFAELYDRVINLKSFLYSWQTGLGSPFLGNFFNYLSSPSAIIMLLLGHENMPEAIAGMIITKAALAAASFTYYIKKSRGRHDFSSAAFGILYAMCGYFVAYYWNVMWIDTMVYFPLVILGIENIINKRNPRLYIPMLALTLVTNYYMGFMTCIFSVLYFLVYFMAGYDFSSVAEDTPVITAPDGTKKIKFKDKVCGNIFLRSGFTFAFSSIAAAGIVAFALLPIYFCLKNCSATSGTFPETVTSYFSIFDFLANHLASVDPTIRSSGDDVLPNVYCGIATLILVPLYLFTRSISIKEKAAYVGLLGILYFSFNLNVLNYIWHGFHYPNDLPYRFSFMYCFVLLILAYQALTRLHEFSGRAILGSGLGVLGAIILIQEIGSKNVEETTVLISIVFTVTYCLVFALLKNEKMQKSAVAVLLLCCIIGEIACANTDRYSMDQPKSNFTGDYGDFRTVKGVLDSIEENDMYRMELTRSRARMDPAWYGYNGVSTFSSMAYEKMSNAQSKLGMFSNYINSYTYHLQTPVYNMMHSLKYIVDNNDNVTPESDYYAQVAQKGKFTAYENKYYLPVGFAADKSVTEWYTDFNNPFRVQGDWFEYATGLSGVFEMMTIEPVSYYNFDEITSGLTSGDIYYTKPTAETGEACLGLRTTEARHCYLYVNSSTFESITITKNGETFDQDISEPYIYDLGIVSPEDDVTVLITVEDSDYGFVDFYPYYVNEEVLNKGYEILRSRQLNITSFEETKITGTVSTTEDTVFFTSIPYDTGWTVKINGEEIAKEDYIALNDAYLCFNLPAGDNTQIELSFFPEGLAIGSVISVLTLIALILAAMLFSHLKKEKERKRIERLEAEAERAALLEAQRLEEAFAKPESVYFPDDGGENVSFMAVTIKIADSEEETETEAIAEETAEEE
ncbi:MAG: YfhO family protein [Clostridia bacterium]|nr:YfhO family protein [Clostridia bacterium]